MSLLQPDELRKVIVVCELHNPVLTSKHLHRNVGIYSTLKKISSVYIAQNFRAITYFRIGPKVQKITLWKKYYNIFRKALKYINLFLSENIFSYFLSYFYKKYDKYLESWRKMCLIREFITYGKYQILREIFSFTTERYFHSFPSTHPNICPALVLCLNKLEESRH